MNEYPKVFRNGELVSKDKAKPKYVRRQAFSAISDNMDMLKHHGTGQHTDSKSEFRKMTRACGAVELGNEVPVRKIEKLSRQERARDIKTTIEQLKSR